MKCPKCGYLGFETTDRCRNCGYDFSLTPAEAEPDLSLNREDESAQRMPDFDLADSRASAPELDLDRLFGTDGSKAPPAPVTEAPLRAEPRTPRRTPSRFSSFDPAADPSALPFDDGPPVGAPRPARHPLGVRRATPEVPRGRPKTTRPIRIDPPLDLGGDGRSTSETSEEDAAASSSRLIPASLGARLGALFIDATLLLSIAAAVLTLTLRIVGLALSWDDVRVLPPVPFIGFLIVVLLGYLATFTVAGGQTIGKMMMRVRVMGDDGRAVDLSGSVLRAVGCALVPLTLGLSYAPVLLTTDRRALHDRLAGTRVVSA